MQFAGDNSFRRAILIFSLDLEGGDDVFRRGMLVSCNSVDFQGASHKPNLYHQVLGFQELPINKRCQTASVKATGLCLSSLGQTDRCCSICKTTVSHSSSNAKRWSVEGLFAGRLNRGYQCSLGGSQCLAISITIQTQLQVIEQLRSRRERFLTLATVMKQWQ